MTTPEGEGAQGGAEGTQSGAGETTGNNGGTESGTSGEGTQSGAQTPSEAERLSAELAKQRERTQAADQRAAKIEAELRQLRDKDLPEQEKLQRDYAEAQKQVEQLQTTNGELALKVAFLEDNTYSWQNPKRAMQLIDTSQLEIQPDGSVSGLKEALKALATSDPYLLKQEAGTTTAKPEPGGTAPGNNGGAGGKATTGKGLAQRFPALNTRVKRS